MEMLLLRWYLDSVNMWKSVPVAFPSALDDDRTLLLHGHVDNTSWHYEPLFRSSAS